MNAYLLNLIHAYHQAEAAGFPGLASAFAALIRKEVEGGQP